MAKKAKVDKKEDTILEVVTKEVNTPTDEYVWLVGTGDVIPKGKVFRQTPQGAKVLIEAGRAELKK